MIAAEAIVGLDTKRAADGHQARGQSTGTSGCSKFDDIQHILLTRAPAPSGRIRVSVVSQRSRRPTWVSAIKEKIHSAASMRAGIDKDKRWVTAAFTWNGLRALGLDEASLASFPDEFKQGHGGARGDTRRQWV